MDLHCINTVLRPRTRAELPGWQPGDAYLSGGTWLFSEPQSRLRRLIDLAALGWPAFERPPDGGLTIAATCRFAELERFAAEPYWPAAALFTPAVHALWGSFKIHNAATIGGNLCLALPAAPMAALSVALDAQCLIWTPQGSERTLPAHEFITDAGRNALQQGEILRAIRLPQPALRRRAVLRQASLTRYGRSAALLIGTLDPDDGAVRFTVTASVRAPLLLQFDSLPSETTLSQALGQALSNDVLHDDVHGAPFWKRHMTLKLAELVRQDLSD